MGFRPVFSDTAVAFFATLGRRKQLKLIDLAQQLAAAPSVVPDFRSKDETGRDISHLLLDDFLFEYWVDGAVRLVMILNIEDAE